MKFLPFPYNSTLKLHNEPLLFEPIFGFTNNSELITEYLLLPQTLTGCFNPPESLITSSNTDH